MLLFKSKHQITKEFLLFLNNHSGDECWLFGCLLAILSRVCWCNFCGPNCITGFAHFVRLLTSSFLSLFRKFPVLLASSLFSLVNVTVSSRYIMTGITRVLNIYFLDLWGFLNLNIYPSFLYAYLFNSSTNLGCLVMFFQLNVRDILILSWSEGFGSRLWPAYQSDLWSVFSIIASPGPHPLIYLSFQSAYLDARKTQMVQKYSIDVNAFLGQIHIFKDVF